MRSKGLFAARRRLSSRIFKGLLILALLLSVCFVANAYAEEKIEFNVRWDNDKFLRSNKDRYYTNGLKLRNGNIVQILN